MRCPSPRKLRRLHLDLPNTNHRLAAPHRQPPHASLFTSGRGNIAPPLESAHCKLLRMNLLPIQHSTICSVTGDSSAWYSHLDFPSKLYARTSQGLLAAAWHPQGSREPVLHKHSPGTRHHSPVTQFALGLPDNLFRTQARVTVDSGDLAAPCRSAGGATPFRLAHYLKSNPRVPIVSD